jgi:hypothetical protein
MPPNCILVTWAGLSVKTETFSLKGTGYSRNTLFVISIHHFSLKLPRAPKINNQSFTQHRYHLWSSRTIGILVLVFSVECAPFQFWHILHNLICIAGKVSFPPPPPAWTGAGRTEGLPFSPNRNVIFACASRLQINRNVGSCLILFIYSLFNDAFSSSDYTASNERMRMIVNNELERMWKEAVLA